MPVHNADIAAAVTELADLLEIQQANAATCCRGRAWWCQSSFLPASAGFMKQLRELRA